MKFTKQDLKDGKCAVINDGTKEQLVSLLTELFPDDITPTGDIECYYSPDGIIWRGSNSTNLPTQSIEDFLFEPKRGDKVLMSMNERDWEERIYVTTIEGAYYPYVSVALDNEDRLYKGELFYTVPFAYMKKLEPKILELTLEEIAEKFGVDVNTLKIKK